MKFNKWVLLSPILVISSCVQSIPFDLDEVSDKINLFPEMYSTLIATTIIDVDTNEELVEMVDVRNPHLILIHSIRSQEGEETTIEETIVIDDVWVYRSLTQSKEPRPTNTTALSDQDFLVTTFTELVDFSMFYHNTLISLIEELDDCTITLSSDRYTLRGEETSKESSSDTRWMVEMVYGNTQLYQLHFRLEYLFESTKQENNYVRGTHYYFEELPEIEVPELSSYTEVNE